jgi:hypothetical protein
MRLMRCCAGDEGLVALRRRPAGEMSNRLRSSSPAYTPAPAGLHPNGTGRAAVASGQTKLVYCKDTRRRDSWEHTSFKFLGYMFGPRKARYPDGKAFTSFLPAVNRSLARAIGDAAWGELARILTYRQHWRGGEIVRVDRWFPSTKPAPPAAPSLPP